MKSMHKSIMIAHDLKKVPIELFQLIGSNLSSDPDEFRDQFKV